MTASQRFGLVILVLALLAELGAVWLLPRLGVPDPVAGLLAAGLIGALVGGAVVWFFAPSRRG